MKFIFVLAALTLTGCALTPETLGKASTERLCFTFSSATEPMFMNPSVKDELTRRGATYCTTPEYIAARAASNAAAFQNMGTSLQLLQLGQQRTYAPVPAPTIPQQIRCTSQYNAITKTTQTICN
jgi:hypothetical protein